MTRRLTKCQGASDAHENTLHAAREADLARQDVNGQYPRTIIRTADPARYCINVGDYLA